MIEDGVRSIAYICPACRETVVIRESAFSLAAAERKLDCPCGGSHLRAQLTERTFHLSVPCVFCGGEHTMRIPARHFLKEPIIAYACAPSGFDCCYTGEEGSVFQALQPLEEAVTKLEQDEGQERDFFDDIVMHEVLSELRDIAQRGGVRCQCGSDQFGLKIQYAAIELICGICGGQLRIPASSADHITDICCKSTLTIPKKV